jgi:hypothetical protein
MPADTHMRRIVLFVSLIPALLGQPAHNVILVTADGLRTQEVFGGLDPLFANEKAAGMERAQAVRDRYWRETPEARRAVLMPFFWTEIAAKGTVRSNVVVTNKYRVSFPGYSEILTGRAQDDRITGNIDLQNPTETVLEFVRRKLSLGRNDVALFGSWNHFRFIGESKPGTVFINSGYEEAGATPRLAELSRIQSRALTGWATVRHDYVTCEMALDYMRVFRPRLLYVALGETDDWAHGRRYDMVLRTAEYFDECLASLWRQAQSLDAYKGRTAMIVTTDHGRGATLEDWNSHGSKVAGAEKMWMALLGAGVPATGVSSREAAQRDVAPTILRLLGIDYREYTGVLGQPVVD